MKANRQTIPILARELEPFENGSGTLKGIKSPSTIPTVHLEDTEKSRLRIDNETAGIQYVILSYNTPIAWVTNTGWTHKVSQKLSQTSRKHMELLDTMFVGFNADHVIRTNE